MNLNEVTYAGGTPIDGYGPGFFRVGGKVWEGALMVLPDGPATWDGTSAPIAAAAGAIDVLLYGTGPEIAHPDPAFRSEIEAAGLGLEVMASPAACRTYNVLLGEGRRVAVILKPV